MSGLGETCLLCLGNYELAIPKNAPVTTALTERNSNIADQKLHTHWNVDLGDFYFQINLSSNPLSRLKDFVEKSTKTTVLIESLNVNEIPGKKWGDYSRPRTWIDWWFRKDELTLCVNLQSTIYPFVPPTERDKALHEAIIQSLR